MISRVIEVELTQYAAIQAQTLDRQPLISIRLTFINETHQGLHLAVFTCCYKYWAAFHVAREGLGDPLKQYATANSLREVYRKLA